jgi:hypothetical protein
MDAPMPITTFGHESPTGRLLYSAREVEAILGVSHAFLYRLISSGRIDARKIDNKTVIPASSLKTFIAGLPKAGEAAA